MAWLDDMRRVDNGNLLRRIGKGVLAIGKIKELDGLLAAGSLVVRPAPEKRD